MRRLQIGNAQALWLTFVVIGCILSWINFASLGDHLLDAHDQETFDDNIAIAKDFSLFFSPLKQQATGRPTAEFVKYVGYVAWGNDPRSFHLLSVGLHTASSLLLPLLFIRCGLPLYVSFLAALLFLVRASHFQAVHHVSALDYPLALALSSLAILAYLKALSDRRLRFVAVCVALLTAALGAHVLAIATVPFCLYLTWSKGTKLPRKWLVATGLIGLVVLWCVFVLTGRDTTTWAALRIHAEGDVFNLLIGSSKILLWFLGRTVTTAHWLPVAIYDLQDWELIPGAIVLAYLLWNLRKTESFLPAWSLWTLVTLVPFAFMSEGVIFQPPAGTTRYLYFAGVGMSVHIAWLLTHGISRVFSRSRIVGLGAASCAVSGTFASSYLALKQTEALSIYSSARSYIAQGDFETGIERLTSSLEQNSSAVPTSDLYFHLANALPSQGRDPEPVLREGVARFPDHIWLNLALALVEQESSDSSERQDGRRRMELVLAKADSAGLAGQFAYNLGSFLHNLGTGAALNEDYEGAIRLFNRALVLDPKKQNTKRLLSNAHVMLGNQFARGLESARAVENYRTALAVNPRNTIAKENLGHLANTLEVTPDRTPVSEY